MCGISGYFGSSTDASEELLRVLNEAQKHRGPDAEGIWISRDREVGFAHRRLSIVDLSPAGNQPMRSESGRYTITFNGEIYNFQSLRRELETFGHCFRSASDSEVMLAAFEQWGVDGALERLNGMFAVAVWDEFARQGHLFRDRLGVKPLYYQWHGQSLFFSSELSQAFAELSDRSISRDALALLFSQGYIPAPLTIFFGIHKLMPGTIASFALEDIRNCRFGASHRYADAQKRINHILGGRNEEMTEEEALERLDATLRRSVRDRMIADVPLGAFLSGGIDSSLIVSYMQQVSSSQVRTFTIGFEESKFSEAPYARKIAEHLETMHTELIVTENDALQVVSGLPKIYGEPFADSSQIPTYLVAKLTREHVTVALSGDAGDELFAGYNRYRSIRKYGHAVRMVPNSIFIAVSGFMAYPGVQQFIAALAGEKQTARILNGVLSYSTNGSIRFAPRQWGPTTLPERLVRGARAGVSIQLHPDCAGNPIEQAMCQDLLGYLPDDILVKVDRASMAVSLEVRAPFADDFELFDLAWRIPLALKMNGGNGKLVLRKLLARFVPSEFTDRAKMGFAVPLTKWMRGALREWVADCVSPSRLNREGFLRSDAVARVRRRALEGDEYYVHKLWSICQFQSWLDMVSATAPRSELGSCYAIS